MAQNQEFAFTKRKEKGDPLFPPFLDGSVCFGFCHIKNDKGNACGMKNVDCFGHHAFICPCTSKHTEHNAIRNVINSEAKGLGFISEKEVALPQFSHRADNLLTDLETGKLPYAIDITIRACHQQGIATVERVVNAAVREKRKEFATKDGNGRKEAEVFVVPFVMTSMGNIDAGATKFLNTLKDKDPFKTRKMMDLISVQHAKWIAVRLRRCLGFHSRTLEESKGKIYLQPPKGPKHDRSKQGKKGEFARLSSVLSQQSGSQEKESARATRAKGSKPAPKRLVKPCASPLHPRETQSTPAESGWTQSVREELQGDDSALSALAVMESFDEREPFSQDIPFSRGIRRAESAGAFSRFGEQHAP